MRYHPLPGQGSELAQQQEERCARLALESRAGKDLTHPVILGALLCQASQAAGYLSTPGLVVWPREYTRGELLLKTKAARGSFIAWKL